MGCFNWNLKSLIKDKGCSIVTSVIHSLAYDKRFILLFSNDNRVVSGFHTLLKDYQILEY